MASRMATASALGVGSVVMAPSPATSGMAPRLLATTGAPLAMASRIGSPNPSYSEGTATTDAARYRSARCGSSTRPSQWARAPRTICSPPSAGRPTSANSRSGSPIRAMARASAPMFLRGWMSPTAST
jgi:hypothetical protein